MCRHFLLCLNLLVTCVDTSRICVDTSTLLSLVKTYCLFVSTFPPHVLTLDHQSFKSLATVYMCRHFNVKCRHFLYFGHCLHVSTLRQVSILQTHVLTLFVLELILWTLTFFVDTFTFMCRYFNFRFLTVHMYRHFFPMMNFFVFLGRLIVDQFKFLKRSSFWIYTFFKIFNSVSFIASSIYIGLHQIFQYSSQVFMYWHFLGRKFSFSQFHLTCWYNEQ